jgi:hypothetical protein
MRNLTPFIKKNLTTIVFCVSISTLTFLSIDIIKKRRVEELEIRDSLQKISNQLEVLKKQGIYNSKKEINL